MLNQVNKPVKGKRIDPVWKVYFKHDGCSMLLFKNLTQSGAYCRVRQLEAFKWQWCGRFIVTK